ncbi:tRNA dihydrouridine synthase DusB [Candidatus Woesearchaeota archaeon]|nr:tRNA dihydrouridine synthase DusB [Candidatus Woesearchaeota archaeon]
MNFSSKVFLAPMAGITDPAFRAVCAKSGAGMTVTELVSAQGILKNNEKTKEMIARAEQEKKFAIQLFGSDPTCMAKAAEIISSYCDIIDINMGCPVDKVCKLGGGSALLQNPQLAGEIVHKMACAVNNPITAKMRIGLSNPNENLAIALAKACEDNGASMITVHGRMQVQKYSGSANWKKIKEVKDAVNIPVVGNGDISTPELAKLRLQTTNYVSIGRACSGNPLLFKEITTYLDTGKYEDITPHLRLSMFEQYLDFAQEFGTSLVTQRLQAQHFTKGFQGASEARLQLNAAQTPTELLTIVSSLLEPFLTTK